MSESEELKNVCMPNFTLNGIGKIEFFYDYYLKSQQCLFKGKNRVYTCPIILAEISIFIKYLTTK